MGTIGIVVALIWLTPVVLGLILAAICVVSVGTRREVAKFLFGTPAAPSVPYPTSD